MVNLGPERRLAAVLAADMVGYSRLMEVDEAGTLARLKTHRLELIDPAITKNRGVSSRPPATACWLSSKVSSMLSLARSRSNAGCYGATQTSCRRAGYNSESA